MTLSRKNYHRNFPWLLMGLALLASQQFVYADGWHNAALATGSLDQWLNDVKQVIPNLDERLNPRELKSGTDIEKLKQSARSKPDAKPDLKSLLEGGRGGKLQADLSPQQRAVLERKAGDCMEVLACMDERNIVPGEFPAFQISQIPKYREAARQMLKLMGGSAVTAKLRSELMGMGHAQVQGLQPHPSYYKDLLDVLRDSVGNGTIQAKDLADLRQAAAGQKHPQIDPLAKEVNKILNEVENAGVGVLLNWAVETTDKAQKQQIYRKLRQKMPEATLPELLAVKLQIDDRPTQQAAAHELEKRWTTAGVLDLLTVLETLDDADIRRTAGAALAERSPKYAEVKDELADIWKLAGSSNKQVAAAAREQTVNAFLRAPIGECLDWLGQTDEGLKVLIWEQLDDRISRADTDRKAGYAESALMTLGDKQSATAGKLAALDLLARVKDSASAGPLIELLPTLPREAWPKAGAALKSITGQNFGPRPGDGVAEVSVAVKQWRTWWKDHGGK